MSVNDSPNSDADLLSGLIELHREEEERLRAMTTDLCTSPEVRNQANIKLSAVLAAIRGYEDELVQLCLPSSPR